MSSDARTHVLTRIRRSLNRGELPEEARAELDRRINEPKPGVVPARATGEHAALVERFVEMAEFAAATVTRVPGMEAVPHAVADWLKGHNLGPKVVAAPDATLDGLEGHGTLEVTRGVAHPADQASVTPCFAGVAETGTLVLLSGPDNPTSLNFLPDNHIIVVRASQIVGGYEEAWAKLRAQGAVPRTVNMVTGPSRTGDIEQTLQLGAHGPRRLHIVLIDDQKRGTGSGEG
ncbi:lactate utilization protein C [Caenispirillum salinarum]|uniref:LutC/YkgG family protein n=1 Tax=Caenispirillum salinarum TaxID=859058 RepID=UPI00384C8FBF